MNLFNLGDDLEYTRYELESIVQGLKRHLKKPRGKKKLTPELRGYTHATRVLAMQLEHLQRQAKELSDIVSAAVAAQENDDY